jgi:DNA repair protein RadC
VWPIKQESPGDSGGHKKRKAMKKTLMIQDVALTYKKTSLPVKKIIRSITAAEIARKTIPDDQIAHREFFGILLLNNSSRVLRRSIISTGGLNSCVFYLKHIMKQVLLANAAALILFHNHPSGEVKPSDHDIRLTNKIKEACNIMDVILADHIILSGYVDSIPNYLSFADEGLV